MSDKLTIRAIAALNRSKEYKRLEEELSLDKEFFRKEANKNLLTVPVEGMGKVTVKTPSAAVNTFGLQFDEDAYNELSPALKNKLTALGVVKRVRVTRPEGVAAVTFTLNT